MFLTDFRTRKYTRGIISRVGIFLTVTPAPSPHPSNLIYSTLVNQQCDICVQWGNIAGYEICMRGRVCCE